MQYEWILDVLNDLRTFAQANGLAALSEQLDDTSHVAAAEIALVTGQAAGGLGLDAETLGRIHFGTSAGDNA